jgi:hypothetical protein
MLISPVFNESIRSMFRDDAQDDIDIQIENGGMLVRVFDNGQWLNVFGFEKIYDGVYWTDFNPDHILESIYGFDNIVRYAPSQWPMSLEDMDSFVEYYGVGDSPDQVLAHPDIQRAFVNSDKAFVACFTPILKSDQPARDGWRWHKWGEYIGNQNSQHEYLYDEDDIEEVVVYHFYQILNWSQA